MKVILVVDDNDVDRELIRRFLGSSFETSEAATVEQAYAELSARDIDCIVLDYRLPGTDGLALLEKLPADRPPVVVLTGQGGEQIAVEAMKRGADDYLAKSGLDPGSLRRAIEHAIDKALLRHEVARRDAQIRMMLDQLPATVWTTDTALTVTSLFGSPRGVGPPPAARAVGKPLVETISADGRVVIAAHERALGGEASDYEIDRGGRVLQCRVEPMRGPDGRVTGVLGVAADVTETRKLAEQLRHSQKIEALGRLAGGVAHDFNNILTAIVSYAEVLGASLGPSSELKEDVDGIREAAWRATDLVKQLLAFSRLRPAEHRAVDAGAATRTVVPMLRRLLGETITLDVDASSSWTAAVDDVGFEQLLVNLVVNARDAMPRGGRIRVGVKNKSVREPISAGSRGAIAPGEYVLVSVEDQGIGIAPELIDRIFEPFFTTKDIGKGTGLGLSTVYGIVHQAGGEIVLASELGKGTTFDAYLPRSHVASGRRSRPTTGQASPLAGAALIVEDDRQVRVLVERALRSAGMQVVAAATPREALDWARRNKGPLRLVLTDLVLPEMMGNELAEAIREMHPAAAFLYMSGHVPENVAGRLEGAILEKPFTQQALLAKVADALGATAA
ncbi:MAG TPA: response regulator [Kofleriaceae bacterium]|nr:response regulator [Kofleriaceae bacterium]